MKRSDEVCLSARNREEEINGLLECIDGYIIQLARKNFPRSSVMHGETDLEMDDLAQNIRVKLWLAMRRGTLFNMKAYSRSIAYTESVDIVRRCNRMYPLALDQEGELCQGNVIRMSSQGEYDPAGEFERKESLADCMEKTVNDVLKLSPRQQYATICVLKDQVADILPLREAFVAHGLDIEAINWPKEKEEERRLRASFYAARAKLRSLRAC